MSLTLITAAYVVVTVVESAAADTVKFKCFISAPSYVVVVVELVSFSRSCAPSPPCGQNCQIGASMCR